jgi:predicted  nucleic acid-binding Zn-ribbon protein
VLHIHPTNTRYVSLDPYLGRLTLLHKFFLRGTQLSQLSDEYDTCLENITQTTKVLQQKKEALPDLRKVFKDASTRFEEANKAREQKKKADELKKELAWAHVATKENVGGHW